MKRPISTDKAPGAIGPYSQAVRVGDMLFVSGQLPLDPKTGKFPEGIEAQTRQSLTNVRSILEAARRHYGQRRQDYGFPFGYE